VLIGGKQQESKFIKIMDITVWHVVFTVQMLSITNGWMVPAVPTEENDAYWGYSSIPQAGCEWWYHLPSLSEQTKAELKQLAHLVIEHAKLKQRRGRKPSMTFWGQRNPQKALTLALKYAS
jgi:hypothetical protein